MKVITKTIWFLSVISLCTDMASEMLYPIMPIYLKSITFSIVLIGVLEGFAEALAGLSKGYFGKLSDLSGKRVPFVQLGYSLSALAKPMMGLFVFPAWIFLSRTLDRLGKGIRTGARDAILSDEATKETKGKVFGFHRSMDTMGAVIGPALALLYLYFYPKDYRTLFFIAFFPGVLAILTTFLLKEKKSQIAAQFPGDLSRRVSVFSFFGYWKTAPPSYRKLVGGLLAFTLINSSDVFLLLKAKDAGLNDTGVILVYIFYNLIYALASYPTGILADKLGMKKTFIVGLILFSIVYLSISFVHSLPLFLILFFIYGLYAAATEGISKAWISNISEKKDTATAIGTYAGFQSICTMLASSLAGLMWALINPTFTFMFTGIATVAVVVYFLFFVREKVTYE